MRAFAPVAPINASELVLVARAACTRASQRTATSAAAPALALQFLDLLAGDESLALRRAGGFEA